MIRHTYHYYLDNFTMDHNAARSIPVLHHAPGFPFADAIDFPERFPDRRAYNSAELINPFNGTEQFYAKIHLVPFGEWLPYYQKIPFVRTVIEQAGAASYSPWTNFTVMQTAKAKFGVMICFEDLFAILARKFVKLGINYFLNTTNDGWAYRWQIGSDLPLWQHVSGATLVAISVRRPIARAVNTGVTCVIDLTGKTAYSDVPIYQRGVFVHDISIIDASVKSIYVRFGFLFPYLIVFAALGIFAYSVFFYKPAEVK
jgi:apolipoprotein N-acyltransferase